MSYIDINDPVLRARVVEAINLLVGVCHGLSAQAGWWHGIDPETDKHVVPAKLCLVHSEISEAMEGHRKGKMDDHLPEYPMITVELGDALIREFDLAGKLGLTLGDAVAAKLAYNASRADHKLENRLKEGGKAY